MNTSKQQSGRGESGLQFGDITPSETADRELRWFFNEAEMECDQPSNYVSLLAGITVEDRAAAVEHRAEAVHAAGKVRGRLEKLSTTDALTLEGVYRERMWSRRVETALGPLAGAVAALPTVRVLHLRALATARTEADTVAAWIEELASGRAAVLAAWKAEAERNCAVAIRAYERARGKSECVVPDAEVQ